MFRTKNARDQAVTLVCAKTIVHAVFIVCKSCMICNVYRIYTPIQYVYCTSKNLICIFYETITYFDAAG